MSENYKNFIENYNHYKINEEELGEYIAEYIETKDDNVFYLLFHHFKNTVEYTIKKKLKVFDDSSVDFLYQEGMIGLFKAIDTVDFNGNISAYIKKCIKTEITNSCKKNIYNDGKLSSRKNNEYSKLKDLDYLKKATSEQSSEYEKIQNIVNGTDVIDNIDIDNMNYNLSELLGVLNNEEYKIMLALYYGYSQIEIANQLKVSKQAINERIKRIKGKVEDYIMG